MNHYGVARECSAIYDLPLKAIEPQLPVASAAKAPFPIEITKTGANGGSISFDRWDQPVALTIPADALDITQLQPAH